MTSSRLPVTAKETEKQRATERTLRDRSRATREDEDFVRLMRSDWGRRLVWRLLDRGRIRAPNFDTNAMVQSRHVGVSDFVHRELFDRVLDLCPDLYATMHRENTR